MSTEDQIELAAQRAYAEESVREHRATRNFAWTEAAKECERWAKCFVGGSKPADVLYAMADQFRSWVVWGDATEEKPDMSIAAYMAWCEANALEISMQTRNMFISARAPGAKS